MATTEQIKRMNDINDLIKLIASTDRRTFYCKSKNRIYGRFYDAPNLVSADGLRVLDFQHDYRSDMKANLALIGVIISFTAAVYFKDIDKYIGNKHDK
ncbi:hypothetical protein DJ572_21360 [Bacillus subtilis]|nr:hypothetical protein DJ572_21360 [Bacillus subtilis]